MVFVAFFCYHDDVRGGGGGALSGGAFRSAIFYFRRCILGEYAYS